VQRLVPVLAKSGLFLAALAFGIGLAFGAHELTDNTTSAPAPVANVRGAIARALANDVAGDAVPAGQAPADTASASDPPDAPATTPRDAVHAFLDAEVAHRYDASYGLLSAPDREQQVSRSAWAANHADLPTITSYSIDGAQLRDGRADVAVRLRLHAELSATDGLVPDRARATYAAVAEDGGWRVAFGDSSLEPQYPSTAAAPDAVRAWVRARTQCRHAPEFVGGLLGAPARADRLCGARGSIHVGRVRRLPETAQDQPFLAAFGSAVHDWARVVAVDAPVRLHVVVAPVGEQWLVVGVLPTPSERS
jgi:hypothetical protein